MVPISLNAALIIFLVLAMIISGIWLLKKTAKKFHLSEDELNRMSERNKRLDKEDEIEDKKEKREKRNNLV
jgi:cytidylate kinase